MTNEACPLADRLVDYADGELSATEADAVAQHLTCCPDCRANLQRLQRSLHLARVVWSESAAAACPTKRPGRQRSILVGCAASLLLIAGLALRPGQSPSENLSPGRNAIVEPVNDADFETLLAREVQAARLAASADLLASHSAAAPYDRGALAYLASAYPDTEPGRQAARRANPSPEQSP